MLDVPSTFGSPHWPAESAAAQAGGAAAPSFRPIIMHREQRDEHADIFADDDGDDDQLSDQQAGIRLDAEVAARLATRVGGRVKEDLLGLLSHARDWCPSCERLWETQKQELPPPRACCVAMQPKQAHCWVHHEVQLWNQSGGWCYSCGCELDWESEEPEEGETRDKRASWTQQRVHSGWFHVPLNCPSRAVCFMCQCKSNSSDVRGADHHRAVTDQALPPGITLGGPPAAMASYAAMLNIMRDLKNGLFHRQALSMGLGHNGQLSSLSVALRQHDSGFPTYGALIALCGGSKRLHLIRAQILMHWTEGDPPGPMVVKKQEHFSGVNQKSKARRRSV